MDGTKRRKSVDRGLVDVEVSAASERGDNSTAEKFCNDAGGFAGTVDAVVGLLIGRQTLRVKGAKAGLVAKQRAAGHGHTAGQQNVEGGVQPDDGDAGGAQKLRRTGLRVGTDAELENCSFLVLQRAAQSCTKLIGFHLPAYGLAPAFEDFRNAKTRCLFNAVVQIDEAPSQLAGEQRADGGLAGAHEAGQAKHLHSRLWWSRRKLRHLYSLLEQAGPNPRPPATITRASRCELYHCRRRAPPWPGRCRRCRTSPW